ncbi:MAG TPA: hypothetical protein PK245_06715 [Clostridia bacterium]|nr:hypothetical protein [Clostridia bacterium]
MKKGILIALDAILFLAGFPLLLILVYFQTKHGMDMGYGNGFFQGMGGWVPFLLASILFVVVLIVELVLRLSSKKTIPAGKSTFKKQALKLAAAGFCVLGGLMIVLDIALPELLFDATSNTLLYEDLVGNYDTQHDINNDLIMRFIELNVATGELNEMSEEEYKKLGLNDDKVSELIALKFDSIDSAFVRFNKIAIDMALKGVMTGDIIGLLIVPFSQPTEGYLVYFPMEGNVNMNPDVDGDARGRPAIRSDGRPDLR